MALKYKLLKIREDGEIKELTIMQALKRNGYDTKRFREEGLFSQSTLQKFRHEDATLDWRNINQLCKLLNCQPGDFLEYVPDIESDQDE